MVGKSYAKEQVRYQMLRDIKIIHSSYFFKKKL